MNDARETGFLEFLVKTWASSANSPKPSEPAPVVRAVARLRPEDRERYLEEWAADFWATDGRFRRWCFCVGLRWSAWRLRKRGRSRVPRGG
jgi:hypothetical protein